VKALFTPKQLERLTTVNYKTTPDWEKEVLKVSGPDGASHIIEVGGAGTLEKSHACIKRGGVIANIGFIAQGETPNIPLLNLGSGSIFRAILVGSVEQFKAMNACIETFKMKPLVDKVFDFKSCREAYTYMWQQQHAGKVVISV
jgi:NADPH:quinone reductase-like Zn-dependent oxidoreductase